MSKEQKAKAELAAKAEEATVSQNEITAKGPTQYERDYLISNAAAFNVAPEIVAGALYAKERATKEEATAAIKAFLKTPKTEPNEEKEVKE